MRLLIGWLEFCWIVSRIQYRATWFELVALLAHFRVCRETTANTYHVHIASIDHINVSNHYTNDRTAIITVIIIGYSHDMKQPYMRSIRWRFIIASRNGGPNCLLFRMFIVESFVCLFLFLLSNALLDSHWYSYKSFTLPCNLSLSRPLFFSIFVPWARRMYNLIIIITLRH